MKNKKKGVLHELAGIKRVLIAYAIAGSAVIVPLISSNYNPEPSQITNADIEKEFRHLDDWVTEYVQQDYTKPKTAHVGLAFQLREDKEKDDREGRTPFGGLYDTGEDTLVLPNPKDESNKAHTIRAISHELWHSIYDVYDKKGLLRDNEFQGPSEEEMEEYCVSKLNQPKFENVHAEVFNEVGSKRAEAFLKYINNSYRVWSSLLTRTATLRGTISAHQNTFNSQQRSELEGYFNRLEEIATIFTSNKNFVAQLEEGVRNGLPLVQLDPRIGAMEDAHFSTGGDDLLYETRDLVSRIYEHAKDRGLTESDLSILSKEEVERVLKEQREKDSQIGRENLSVAWARAHTTNEFMARVVSSLYRVYRDEITGAWFPLEEADLSFLERFVYKGKQLFSKGIERYRLALAMAADGVSKTEISKLAHATSFEYKGKTYSWPDNSFDLKGDLPNWKRK